MAVVLSESSDLRPVVSVLRQLPRNGCWTSDKRKKWLKAMTDAVDLVIDVQSEEPPVC